MRRFIASALFVMFSQAGAQSLRDPTLAPVEAGVAGVPAAANSLRVESGSANVIVRDGRAHLVVGTRLYAQGEKLGQARIERITETEVWLREGGELRKVPRFAGIERHALTAAATGTGCAPVVLKKSSRTSAGKRARAGRSKKSGPSRKVSSQASRHTAPPPALACVELRP